MTAALITAEGAIDLLGTFVLHSTAALGLALAVSVTLRDRAVVLQERLLRMALWLPFVSASAQQFGLGGSWALSWSRVPAVDSIDFAPMLAAARYELPLPHEGEPAAAELAALPEWPLSLPLSIALLALVAAGVGLHWLWRSHRQLRHVLRGRQPESDGRVLTAAAAVAGALGMSWTPHLSRSARLATPIAFGWLRPEICLPARAATLGDSSLRAMLAHELAHLRRADPAWMWCAALLQALMPWQPLLWCVRRRWARLVELRCDAVAARESSPAAVARCLLDVADWLRPKSAQHVVALGMAARPSALRERVEAALAYRAEGRPTRLGAVVFAASALTVMTLAAPGVARAGDVGAAGPAPLAIPLGGPPSLTASLAMLDAEYQELQSAAAAFRRNAVFGDDKLVELARQLERRCQNLERMRTRLQAAVAQREPSSIPFR